MMNHSEISLTFGSERHLLGTLTLPEGAPPGPVAFVLFNAGVIHRIGPHRINVKLARHLAGLGIATLRFDLAGQGDSRGVAFPGTYTEHAVSDVRAAMDHVARTTGVERFAIAGICSGADNGWATALADPRVVALCQIDGFVYPTAKTRWMRIVRRAGGPVLSEIGPWLRRRRAAAAQRARADEEQADERPFPPRDVYARTLQSLVDRGVQAYLIFTGSLLPQYNHESQFRDAFAGHGFVAKVRADYRPDIDHTVTPMAAQRQLLDLIGTWARTLA